MYFFYNNSIYKARMYPKGFQLNFIVSRMIFDIQLKLNDSYNPRDQSFNFYQ